VPLGGDDGFAIYQVKAFAANLTSSQKEQIEHSYRRLSQFAVDKELKISRWYLTPLDGTHENHMWLATVTNATNDYEQWRGLTYLDGLAAKFPEVVDYYLADGRDRLQQAMQSLAAAIGIGGFPPPADLTSGSSIDGLAGIHETINKCDPHYRYDVAVSGIRPPLPADEHNLVAAVQVERERVWVTFKIFAKCIESLRERPVRCMIVPTASGVPLANSSRSNVSLFQRLRKGPGEPLPPLSFHGLRHCAASLMLASGADIAVVSKLLGHASISITADVYGHLVGTVASDAVNGAANLIAHTVHTPEGVNAG
jgi:hypothetical protein